MSGRALVRRGLDRALSLAAPIFRRDRRLRILGYHGVAEQETFAAQMEHLRLHYAVVGAEAVCDAAMGRGSLPDRAVWVTFDDGEPSVLEHGLPVLQQYRIPATLFVCPAVIGTTTPLWFQAVREARGGKADALLASMKSLSEADRRAKVALEGEISRKQLSLEDLHRFLDAGCTIANHTWDHPLLDQLPDEEVRRQIIDAHAWLADNLPPQPPVFAFPNGNQADAAPGVLSELGYEVGVLYDHGLADLAEPLALSRVRADASDPMTRFRASVSGAHPTFYSWRRSAR